MKETDGEVETSLAKVSEAFDIKDDDDDDDDVSNWDSLGQYSSTKDKVSLLDKKSDG